MATCSPMKSSSITSRFSNERETASSKIEDDVLLHDVFLCHSGFQKDFVHQLHVDLRRLNISSFFDKDNLSLPKGKRFPSRIFDNIENCKVAVLVLSYDFFTKSKWPMLELSRIVQAKKQRNPGLHILRLFYKISLQDFSRKVEMGDLKEEWKKMEDGPTYLEEWSNSLNFIRDSKAVKALHRSDYTTDVDYREGILNEVVQLLPPNLLFDDSHVQGKERLCSEVDRLFNKVQETEGVKVLGLHGIGAGGKTTMCKCLCNFYEAEFKGKVFYIEFGNGTSVETHKQLLQVVATVDGSALDKVLTKDQVLPILRKFLKDYKVFLALDGLYGDDTKSLDDVICFLKMGYKEGSMIVVTSRDADIFESGRLRQAKIPFVCVPRLQEDEARNILLKDTLLYRKEHSFQQKETLNFFTKNCIFSDAYNPSALKKLGEYLCERFGNDPTKWQVIPNLAEMHWLTEKIYSHHELLMSCLRIGLNNPGLYLGMKLVLVRIFLKEFSGILSILGGALLKALQNGDRTKDFVSSVVHFLGTEEFKELLSRIEIRDFLALLKSLFGGEK